MIDKLLSKLSLNKIKSRRFMVFVVCSVFLGFAKIDQYVFAAVAAAYITNGTFEKIAYLKNGQNQ